MKEIQLRSLKCLFVSIVLLNLSACATGATMDKNAFHSFSFDTRHDSPDIEVIDYQYGSSRETATRPERERVAMGQTFPYGGTNGFIPRGEFLYVKWRVKGSEQVFEDKVDLASRLPADIEGLRIHFVIMGSQLYVYLIWPIGKGPYLVKGPVKYYELQKQVQIYPDQPK